MSDIDETDVLFGRFDWAMVAATAVAMITTVPLGAPPWAAVIVALAGTTIIVFRGACHDLGLIGNRSVDEPETASPSAAERLSGGAPPSSTQPPTLSLPPHRPA
jgi:hypothetical protein